MTNPILARGALHGFDYVVVGAGTALIRTDLARGVPGSYRALLSRLEADAKEHGLMIRQAAFYLPEMRSFENPLDIGGAALSYAKRHPELESTVTVAPHIGMVAIALDFFARRFPSFDTRLLRSPQEATAHLRRRDPSITAQWYELPVPAPQATGT